MSSHTKHSADSSEEIMLMENFDNDSDISESSQTSGIEKLNISARRKIEDYLEEKRLAFLTRDYYFAD